MPFDFKREQKKFYLPKTRPEILSVPPMQYLAVRGKGNPNEEGGDYQKAVSLLYAVSYTLKMSYNTDYRIEGFYEYVVPPLEGFWWQEEAAGAGADDGNAGVNGREYDPAGNKDGFCWISVIRVPDFISEKDLQWAAAEVKRKKGLDASCVELLSMEEGLCVQAMHTGSYDDEPETVEKMNQYLLENGYVNDITGERMHHEIYLSDPNRVEVSKRKTVLRHPVRKEVGGEWKAASEEKGF